jgi:lipopolysaccharide/colanic/teichoic acid biosynthesis glycosyltransferase
LHGGDIVPTQINLRLVQPDAAAPVPEPPPARPRRERAGRGRTVVRPRRGWYLPCKHALDFLLALALSVVALPLVLVAALLVKLTSRGPAFYTQTRVGKDGRLFTIYKIRTMIHNCESLTGPRWSEPGDPRVTPLGWFLRVTHLDELPQLLNVLRGEMSLIGPRPERPEFVPELERALPAYRQRLTVRPGVTGLAQVQQAADSDLDSVRRKLAYDLYYIRHVGFWMDFRLLVGTVLRSLGLPFGALGRLLRVPSAEQTQEEMKDILVDSAAPPRRLCA